MLFLQSTFARAHLAPRRLLVSAYIALFVLSACSSSDADNSLIDTTTSTAAPLSARQAADPLEPTLDPNRTTTTTASTAASESDQILHVLGSIRSMGSAASDWQADVPGVRTDLATIASLTCEPESETCNAASLIEWAAGGVDLLNVATAEASVAPDALAAFVDQASTEGLNIVGYGANEASAVGGVTVGEGDSTIAIHAISLRADVESSAGPDSAGVAGVSAFDALLEVVSARISQGMGVVVIVDTGSIDDRSPSPEQVEIMKRLVDVGVDAIIGHGSDFIQRFDRVGKSTVAYSLGNAVIETTEPLRADSAVLRLEFGTPGRACLLPSTTTDLGPALDDPSVQTCS